MTPKFSTSPVSISYTNPWTKTSIGVPVGAELLAEPLAEIDALGWADMEEDR